MVSTAHLHCNMSAIPPTEADLQAKAGALKDADYLLYRVAVVLDNGRSLILGTFHSRFVDMVISSDCTLVGPGG